MRGASALRWSGLVVTVLVAILVLGGGWVIGSTSGTAWSLQLLTRLVPEVTVEGISGNWQRGVAIQRLSYAPPEGAAITVDGLRLGVGVQRGRRVTLEPLTARAVEIALPPAAAPDEPQPDPQPPEPQPLELPTLSLPLRLAIPALAVERVTIATADTTTAIDQLRASLSWAGSRVSWRDLSLHYAATALQSAGSIQLRESYPLELRMRVTHSDPAASLQLSASGALDALRIEAQVEQPWQLNAQLDLDLLDPALPLQLEATLAQPLPLPADITVERAAIRAAGTVDRLTGELHARADLPHYRGSVIALPFSWDGTTVALTPAVALGDAQGALRASCEVAPLAGVTGRCDGSLAAIDLSPWLATRAHLSTDLALQLDALEPLQLSVRLATIDGTIADQALAGDLQLAIDGTTWRLGESQLRAGANRLAVAGALGHDESLRFHLDLAEPQLLLPEAAGALTVEGQASGELSALSLQAQLHGDALRFGETAIGSLRGSVTIAELGQAPSRIEATLQEIAQGGLSIASADLALSGTLEQYQFSIDLSGLAELAAVRLRCAGAANRARSALQLDCPEWSTRLELNDDAWQWQLAEPLRLALNTTPQRLHVEPFCLTSPEGDVCLTSPLRWEDGSLAALRLHSTGVDLRRATALLPRGATLQQSPQLAFDLNLQGLDPLKLAATASISPTRWQWQTEAGATETLLDTITLDVQADDRRAELTLATSSPDTGRFDAALTVREPLDQRALAGEVTLQALQLEAFRWLAPQFDVAGRIDATLRLGGTLASPTLAGAAQLTDGSAQLDAIGQPLEQVALTVRFDDQAADFDGSLMLAPGRATLDGRLVWEDPAQWQLSARVDGERLHIQPLPDATVALSPALQIEATPARIDVTGRVDIPMAATRIEELPPSAARVSPDAEWVGVDTEQRQTTPLFADVTLHLGEEVQFQGFGADVWLTGGMRLRHSPAQGLRATGEVQVDRGRYRAYGQRLIVRRGTFLFTGPLDNPELNLEAIRELPPTADDQVVGLRVMGPLRNPHAELFAEPSMAESAIAYFLLTGRPPPEAGSTQQISATGALLSLGVAGTGDQTSRLAERFGIHDFQVSTQETETGTQATVSGYLSPRLYVRYGAGIRDGSNSIAFQYRLTSKLVLEAVSGLEEALDLLYSFTID